MLDDVERRRFLVEPAREYPGPIAVRPLDVDLDEGAGQLLLLPRGAGLAGAKPHDHVLPARRLARMQRDVLDDAVALVEDSENRDALPHWSDARLVHARRGGVGGGRRRGRVLLAAPPARREREQEQNRCGDPFHAYSGIHGS
jgi:hypothetical protein